MLRAVSIAALPLLALSLVPSCASSDPDDELLADSSDEAALDGKADGAADGAYTYYEILKDHRACASPMCGGYFLKRLNRSTTVCVTGSTAAQCYAPVLDWSETNLDDGQQAKLVDASNKSTNEQGVFSIVRGRFAKKNTTTPQPNLGRFIITEAWVAEGTGHAEGVFAKVFENGIKCIAAPCPTLTEKGLNSSNQANIADLDFTDSGLTDRQVQGFVDQYTAPTGIIIAGDRYTFKISGRSGKGRTVSNGYHLLVNPPPAAP